VKPIRTKEDYDAGVRRLSEFMNSDHPASEPLADEMEVLATLLESWERGERLDGTVAPRGALYLQRNRLTFECSLLAKAWIERARLAADEITRKQIDALAEQHYVRGQLEPISDRPPHPWRMTPELAALLSELAARVAIYFGEGGVDDEAILIAVAREVAEEVRKQAT